MSHARQTGWDHFLHGRIARPQSGEINIIKEYFNMNAKQMGFFLIVLVGTGAFVALAHGIISGSDRWFAGGPPGKNLSTAAAAVSPGIGSGTRFICPQRNTMALVNFTPSGAPYCTGCGQGMGFHRAPFSNPTLAAAGVPRTQANTFGRAMNRYVCARNCAAGPPNFDTAGTPYCAGCGQVMGFHRTPLLNPTLAAAGRPRTQANAFSQGRGRYVCARNCAAGPPNFDSTGTPYCPGCGQVMGFR